MEERSAFSLREGWPPKAGAGKDELMEPDLPGDPVAAMIFLPLAVRLSSVIFLINNTVR